MATTHRSLLAILITCLLLITGLPAQAQAQTTKPGAFVPLAPSRILDTRSGIGAGGPVGPGQTIDFQVAGVAGIPQTGVAAVVLNVTVAEARSFGFVTAFPAGSPKPNASNLNYSAGQTVPNLVVVKLGVNGRVALANTSAGSVALIADASGYYLAGDATAPGSFVPLEPSRTLDTRFGVGAGGPVAPNGSIDVQITGRAGVPASGVAAVVLNITVTEARSYGFITAHPTGEWRPNASNLNYVAGQTVPNLAMVKLGAGGKISLFNASAGSVALIADVAGYYLAGGPAGTGAFVPLSPSRVVDTRENLGTWGPVWGNDTRNSIQIAGRGGVPAAGVSAVVLNITVTEARSYGFVTAYPADQARPNASNLNYVAGQTVPNLAVVKLSSDGRLALSNISAGSAQVIADVAGYFVEQPYGSVAQIGSGQIGAESYYNNWSWPDDVNVLDHGDGTLSFITHQAEQFIVTRRVAETGAIVNGPHTISMPGWTRWGTAILGTDGYYYVLVGQYNWTEDPDLDVMALRRYDANWQLSAMSLIKGGVSQGVVGIRTPFDAGRADMVQVGNRMVIHMARLMFRSPSDGLNHQGNMTIEVDLDTMTATPFGDLGGMSYSSHSFSQWVAMSGSDLIMVDHGDAYPRAVQIGVMADYPNQRNVSTHLAFSFNGVTGDNFTGATVTGLAPSATGALVVGNSISHPDAPNGPLGARSESRNAYVVAFDKTTGASQVRWLSSYPATGSMTASEPRIVQVSADRYVVLFRVWHDKNRYKDFHTEYRVVDAQGNVLVAHSLGAVEFSAAAQPRLVGGKIYWVANQYPDASTLYLFGVDVTNLADPRLLG